MLGEQEYVSGMELLRTATQCKDITRSQEGSKDLSPDHTTLIVETEDQDSELLKRQISIEL